MNKWDQIGIKKGKTGVFSMGLASNITKKTMRLLSARPTTSQAKKTGHAHHISNQSITFAMPTPTGGGTPPSVVYYMIPSQIRNFKKPTLFDLNIPPKKEKNMIKQTLKTVQDTLTVKSLQLISKLASKKTRIGIKTKHNIRNILGNEKIPPTAK